MSNQFIHVFDMRRHNRVTIQKTKVVDLEFGEPASLSLSGRCSVVSAIAANSCSTLASNGVYRFENVQDDDGGNAYRQPGTWTGIRWSQWG